MIDGGTFGDLTIAAHRWEARLLRTRAFVAAVLPTGRRAQGASVPPRHSPVSNRIRFSHHQRMRSGEACALRERRPLGRDIAPDACVRSDCPAQRSPVVVRRRTGPRYVLESHMRPSAFICVICGFFRSVGGLGGLGVFAVQDCDVFGSSCLRRCPPVTASQPVSW